MTTKEIFWTHLIDWATHTNDHIYYPKFIRMLVLEAGFKQEEAELYFNEELEKGKIYHCCGKYYGLNK